MPEEFQFDTMTKLASKLSVSLFGPAGSGKTTAAIKLAMGIRDKLYPGRKLSEIGLFVDTERKSSSKSVGREVGGETLEALEVFYFDAPYDIYRLADLISYAVGKGKLIIIVDSFTHFWSGTDGILEQVADLEVTLSANKKAYGAWSEKTIIARKNLLKMVVSNANAHMIFCMRAKTEYEISKNDFGKTTIRTIGVKEDMQPDVPYEYDVVLSVDRDTHGVSVMKDRIGFTEYRLTQPVTDAPITVKDGAMLAQIVSAGIPLEELAALKKKKLVDFILDEKSHKSSKVALLEETKKLTFDEKFLSSLSYDTLVKVVQTIK